MANKLKLLLTIILSIFLVIESLSQSNNIEGIYINNIDSDKTIQLKIIKINDSFFYYELSDISTNIPDPWSRRTSGVLKFNEEYSIYSSDAFGDSFKLAFSNEAVLYIDPASIKFYPAFTDFGGKYIKKQTTKPPLPAYSDFYKKDHFLEYQDKKNITIDLYRYPVESEHKQKISLPKGCKLRIYNIVFDAKTNYECFYYVMIALGNNHNIYGWIEPILSKFKYLFRYNKGEIEKTEQKNSPAE